MNLPFIKNFNKKILPVYFLVLVLRDEKVSAVIFEEIQGVVKIVGQKEQHFPSSIDVISQEEFLDALDKAISQAESTLPENVQTQKTVFGVKESWTDNDQIKKEHLARLKKASEELGLTPIGFLVISQAISHLLQKEEGAPISAILAEVNKKSVTVTLVRAGKIIESKSAEIHESIPFTVDTLLKHFNIPEILPSRIIIFNGKEDLSQEFISHTWSKSLPFLHLPQITNLPDRFDAKSVLFGAATQMGFEILEKDIPKESRRVVQEEPIEEKIPEGQKEDAESPIDRSTLHKNLGTKDFGFAKDVDVAKMPASPKMSVASRGGPASQSYVHETERSVVGKLQDDNLIKIQDFQDINQEETKGKSTLIDILTFTFAIAKKINLRKILSLFNKIPRGKGTIILPAILIAIITLVASYFLFIKATIAIIVDPKITERTANVVFSAKDGTDTSKNIIKGEFVSTSEEGSVSTAATGKKDVGTNAKGTVIIFNSLSQSKTLAAGTILKAPNGLLFRLDSSVAIKGVATHSADEVITPEKTTANVTADQLGKESNLPSGTKFSVGSFDTSDSIAKNDNPFSGGTKKEVTVVSKIDSGKLETELIKQLEEKARKELLKQIGDNKILLPSFIIETLSKKSLNAKVGDEATQVTLSGTVEYQGISYDKSDLIAFSKLLLSKDIPSNQEIDYNNIKTDVKDIQNKNDENVEANLNIKALLLPKLNEEKLLKEIKGKSFKKAEDILYKVPQVIDIDITLFPKIPFLPKNLPNIERNIKILIKING